ncbi:hypothetical protein C5F49_02250 [Nitrosopumilus oxyclinae]|uniref:Uncharacterized protein n=1 Tax=Nitrosopumilus oxyclinae TaxID=1959104 RepID=A0A7D5RDH8_9ARCH|nr:helix-turn-helix transcriptional regulator [Nitrosopumilus oxyclinae]QLH04265.1 hypothetical protein C5F49_02250 [Nitrosopumilus oxyclinae]
MDTIRNANDNLEPGERTMLACENKLPRHAIKSALAISKDHDYTLWIELYEHSLAEKIIDIYSDSVKRKILLHIDKPIAKDELLEKCGVSLSSAYRKFNELLHDGFILPVGYTKSEKRVRVFDKIISKAEFSVSTKISQIRLQVNLSRLPKARLGVVYP